MEKRWLYVLAGILAGFGLLFFVIGEDRLAAAGFFAMSAGLISIGASVGKRVNTKCDKKYLPLQ